MSAELRKQGIGFELEKSLNIFYGKEKVGNYQPDFVIEERVLLEIKAQEFLTKDSEAQLLHYLKSTSYQLDFLVNFGSRKLVIRRWG